VVVVVVRKKKNARFAMFDTEALRELPRSSSLGNINIKDLEDRAEGYSNSIA
jgi:hypothetical protein